MSEYFSERERGPVPAVVEELSDRTWGGVVAAFDRQVARNLFASEFPELCPDGKGISGTSTEDLHATLVSHVPDLDGWPSKHYPPDTAAAMDLVEFAWRYAAAPEIVNHHSFFGHDHLRFNVKSGRAQWRE